MAAEKTLALVLKVVPFSETSSIATLWTREFGKQTVIAKGCRRPKSPFESALDLLALCRIVFLPKPTQGMGILSEAKLERRFRNRQQKIEWLYAGYYVAELLLCLTEDGDVHADLFDLVARTLHQLDPPNANAPPVRTQPRAFAPHGSLPAGVDSCRSIGNRAGGESTAVTESLRAENNALNQILLEFEIGLLESLGHFPLFSHCVGCGRQRTLDNIAPFALDAGGIVCPRCRASHSDVIELTPQLIARLTKVRRQVLGGNLVGAGENDSISYSSVANDLVAATEVQESRTKLTIGNAIGNGIGNGIGREIVGGGQDVTRGLAFSRSNDRLQTLNRQQADSNLPPANPRSTYHEKNSITVDDSAKSGDFAGELRFLLTRYLTRLAGRELKLSQFLKPLLPSDLKSK